MSEREFQPELDDELLSAYLDDALTTEERAAVEARLANDPEAQHLLHQLRSVSQSVQMLPLEGVGRDLSGEILRLVEAKKPGGGGADGGNTSAIGELTPRLPIFGSRRSWIWATLAVAAALMIMVLERGEEKGKQLPTVAQNDGANATSAAHDRFDRATDQTNVPVAKPGEDERKIASLGTPGSPSAAGAPDLSAASTPAEQDKLAMRKLAAPEPSSGGAPTGTVGESGQIAASSAAREVHDAPTVSGGAAPPRTGFSMSASADAKSALGKIAESNSAPRPESVAGENAVAAAKSEAFDELGGGQAEIGDANGLVVVHVSAKPAAIRGGEFEKLLARNGVEFDEKDKSGDSSAAGETRKKSVASASQARDAIRDRDAQKQSVDIVVVDAPRDVVAACMADLQQDASNFASVEVEQPSENKEAASTTPDVAKQLGSEWQQYNRGIVGEKQAAGNQFYAFDSANKDRGQLKAESNPRENARGGQSPANNQEAIGQRAAQANRGRALRVPVAENESQTLSDTQVGRRAAGFGGGGGGSDALRRRAVQQQKPQNENSDDVRVLFMLSPEATSPAPSKKASN